MRIKQQQDFTGDSRYPLPIVLVYRGTEDELEACSRWCKANIQGDWTTGYIYAVDEKDYGQTFHFANKADAMLCKLSHGV